ncbi:MAG TPA: hypothetical protein VMZ31_05695 [Phycisphaerae bacterium]|nr:hypothetical protein [Phycisphaerae bacterium]
MLTSVRARISTVGLTWCVARPAAAFLCLGATGSAAASVDDVIAIARSQEGSIATGRITYRSSEHRTTPLARPDLSAVEWPDGAVPSKPFAGEAIVGRINQDISTRTTLVFDTDRGEWKAQATDLRDLDALIREHGLPQEQRLNLSRGQIDLAGRDSQVMLHQVAELDSSNLNLMDNLNPDLPFLLSLPIDLGVVGAGMVRELDNAQDVVVEHGTWRGQDVLSVTVYAHNGIVATFHLDPEHGYGRRLAQTSSIDGTVVAEVVFEDYRDVNGVMIPFQVINRRYDPQTGELSYENAITVESAEINVPVSEEEFRLELPAGTVVHGLEDNRVLTIPVDMPFELADRAGLGVAIDALRESGALPSAEIVQTSVAVVLGSQQEATPVANAAAEPMAGGVVARADQEAVVIASASPRRGAVWPYVVAIALGIVCAVSALVLRRRGRREGIPEC